MKDSTLTTTLFRPVGQKELDLIRESGWRRFPARLFWQPIFYPVVTEEYAIKIARDWNTNDAASGYVGYVLRFDVQTRFLDNYEPQGAGGRELMEYWIPSEQLDDFNDAIVGQIELRREFRGGSAPKSLRTESRLLTQVEQHPYPLMFATISGAHLYGFPSPDSDYDLRGVHLLPLEQVVSLDVGEETVEKDGIHDGLEIDLVTHDIRKFFSLMLKKNGYVLEQVMSPLIVHTTPEHEELKSIVADCITKHHSHHYLGFAATQWKLFQKESPPRVKPLLYVYRVLLTGIHLMRAGKIEANLRRLNDDARLAFIDELIERKLSGPEMSQLPQADLEFHEREYLRLVSELESASETSMLPERPAGKAALNDLLVRMRLAEVPRSEPKASS